MIMSRLQRAWLILLAAVFFFTIGFLIFLKTTDLLLPDIHIPDVEEPGSQVEHITYDDHFGKETTSQLAAETLEELVSESQPTVEITNSHTLSIEEMIEQNVRESMQRDLNFAWEEHQRYMGIFGDYVAVFRGEPGLGGILVEETDIPIEKLPEFELNNLRQGIAFSTEEEKYSILEGLHFPK